MNSLGVIWSCIKNHLYPVASFAIYNFVVLYSFVFLYFTFLLPFHILATCTFDTCFIKYQSVILNMTTTFHPFILPLMVFPKARFSALYSSSCTLSLSVLLSLSFPLTTTFMQMTLSSTLTQAFLTFKTLFNIYHPG